MYEFDKYEPRLHTAGPVVPAMEFTPVGPVAAMSLLIWGEHCIECAIPACYKTCDLYRARPDGRCRRFAYGLFRNAAFRSVRDYGVEVQFKKWGKIETRGNTRMLPVNRLLIYERVLLALAPVITFLGSLLYRLTRDIRWNFVTVPLAERLCRRLHRGRSAHGKPDAFLLEVYNPEETPVRLMIEISVSRIEMREKVDVTTVLPSFIRTFELRPGYSRHELDRGLFAAVTDSGFPFDISLIPEAEREVKLVFLASDFIRYGSERAVANGTQNVKCVVWDLDNTLWSGVLVEGDKVTVTPAARDLLRVLDTRGVLHSLASKNDAGAAHDELRRQGLDEYFLHPQINWQPKSESIRRIAAKLNIGLDAMAFVDDNPFELAEVRAALPMVTVVPHSDIGRLADDPRFQGSSSADAVNRRLYYREAIVREEELASLGGDFMRFLTSCNIRLAVTPFVPDDLERILELVQRTNQLNFSGRKYKREELDPILADTTLEKHVLRCSDRFGSYGTVGLGIVRRDGAVICVEDFMLSCRVQGKFIEKAFFSRLAATHPGGTASALCVSFRPTDRNKPAQQVLETIGFRPRNDAPGLWLELSGNALACDFITIV